MMSSDKLRLMTLNAHSLIDGDAAKNLRILTDAIMREKIDVVALQEVNQKRDAKPGYDLRIDQLGLSLKRGNYMSELVKSLPTEYRGAWYGFKESYDRFEEGVGIITRLGILNATGMLISSGREKEPWRRRCAVKITTKKGEFISTHMGWWNDKYEPFSEQWDRLRRFVCEENCWIMGDFNAECGVADEGYDTIIKDGFYDTYRIAKVQDDGYTVAEKIDGWEDVRKKRIDYIFSKTPHPVEYSKVVFDGKNYDRISDHYGVMIETEA